MISSVFRFWTLSHCGLRILGHRSSHLSCLLLELVSCPARIKTHTALMYDEDGVNVGLGHVGDQIDDLQTTTFFLGRYLLDLSSKKRRGKRHGIESRVVVD